MRRYDISISFRDAHSSQPSGSSSFRLSKSESECRQVLQDFKVHRDSNEHVDVTSPLALDSLQECLAHCLQDPAIVRCQWFQNFLSPSLSFGENFALSKSNPTTQACEFILQPFDNDVVYVPRRNSLCVDYTVPAGSFLVWKFTVGASTNLKFSIHFEKNTSESYETNNEVTINDRKIVSATTSSEIFSDLVEERCGVAGDVAGTFQAPVTGVVKLTFDNSYSLFRGNYVEYCMQCVSIETMRAAEAAAADLAYASTHTSELLAALHQSTSDVSLDVVAVQHTTKDSNNHESQQNEGQESVIQTSSWMKYAGKIVTATVEGLSGFATASKTTNETPRSDETKKSGNDDIRVAELQRIMKADPSDLCTVCGSGSVKDMLHLARKIDALKEEACLEHALVQQAAATATSAFEKCLQEKNGIIDNLTDENALLRRSCARFEEHQAKSLLVENSQRAEISMLLKANNNLTEKFEKIQKEAGVWNVARGKVEEELFFLSDIREKECNERLAVMSKCSKLQVERNELLQRIAELEQQQLETPVRFGTNNCHDRPDEPSFEIDFAELQEEVSRLQAQKAIDDRKFNMLQTEFQEVITSTRSEISESKMLQYHYQEKLIRLKNEKKVLVAELRSLRDKGLYSSGAGAPVDICRDKVNNNNDRVKAFDIQDKIEEHDYCTEKLSELEQRKELVDLSLSIETGNRTLQELSAKLCQETDDIRSHGKI